MIIVSQDKETIINFENTTRISIIPPVEKVYKYSIAINGCLDLGYYKTKERAKEVLQEIIGKYKQWNKDANNAVTIIPKVYEMPKE